MDRYLEEDLYRLSQNKKLQGKYKNKTIFVTGATGLIGSLIIKALLRLDHRVNVIALIRDLEKAKDIYEDDFERIQFVINDILDPFNVDGDIDYIFHCASITSSKKMILCPVETIDVAITGTRNILELARKKHVQSFVYISSMEVYGTFTISTSDVKEDDMGYVNPLLVRSNYPECKRLCENMCIAYYSEFGIPVKIARLAQTFGPGILKTENRVFAQFARSVIRNEDIVLHTKGLSEGNYCYSRDAINALLLLLICGKDGEAYNISNPKAHTTIANMADMICKKITNNKIRVIFDVPEDNVFGYAADTKMRLNSEKMMALGWKPEIGLEEAYSRLIGSMIETHNY
ncbi:NAD-dependent epimerase/dehydratase family protein [Oribacterium sp. P6A1]|uniref:NAD-dependent epimerase/dehydratase family protein n=1 Tax=Oribacterium sp. P6A1 TaxID=1410612 RepID=UPI00055B0C91|nr:NAD-dependent epimerase/dehydratase family protein [Oribacterium sp. P6A1]